MAGPLDSEILAHVEHQVYLTHAPLAVKGREEQSLSSRGLRSPPSAMRRGIFISPMGEGIDQSLYRAAVKIAVADGIIWAFAAVIIVSRVVVESERQSGRRFPR